MKKRAKSPYIGIAAASRILRIGQRTLLSGLKNGTIPLEFTRFDTVYRFRRDDVEKYFKESFRTYAAHKKLKEGEVLLNDEKKIVKEFNEYMSDE